MIRFVLGISLFVACSATAHVGKQRVVVTSDGLPDGGVLLRREAADETRGGSEDQILGASQADCTGLKKTTTCTEHLTAGICESHKVDAGVQAFRCSWKASIPAGDEPAVPGQCQVDMEAGSCGLTNSTGP
mmetsp:Transcript_73533/g.90240  ORF Transcript_73533/g.90240 Transcript_73533/m.90240 type:complete len:131 (+) Transcript_73533:61-453(+)